MKKIVYLDQNGLSTVTLKQNNALLEEFSNLCNEKKVQIGYSWPHIYETLKASELKQNQIFKLFDSIESIQLKSAHKLMDLEFKNAIYRYLGYEKRIKIDTTGKIFDSFEKSYTFKDIVRHLSMNHENRKRIIHGTKNHDKKMFSLLLKVASTLEGSKEGIMRHYRERILSGRLDLELPLIIPFDLNEVLLRFHWASCNYLNLYANLMCFHYRNQKRKPSGDLADSENALTGSLNADYLMMEGNMCQTLAQVKSKTELVKAELFSNVDELIDKIRNL